MKLGAKSALPSEKKTRGTFRFDRDGKTLEIASPGDLPQAPDWLTEDGRAAWMDLIGRVSTTRSATELDSDLFAHFCNLSGATAAAWRSGSVPPATYLVELRRLSELFRVAGPGSRTEMKPDLKGNAFSRFAGRSREP